jgi:acyl-coenzyme A synthetase/AMP-(fatty) acid ligase
VRRRRLGPSYEGLGALVTGPGPVPDGARSFHSAVESDGPAEIDTLGLEDPAWMLYTSGITHRPKGMLSTQRAALWSVAACHAPIFGLSSGDRLLWPLPLFHSFSHSAVRTWAERRPRTRRERAERAVRTPPSSRIVRDP